MRQYLPRAVCCFTSRAPRPGPLACLYVAASRSVGRPVVPRQPLSCNSGVRGLATAAPPAVPHLTAAEIADAARPEHVGRVARLLEERGIVKVSLAERDEGSAYVEQLIRSLHREHGHRLPVAHSASRGWFWDVRPAPAAAPAAAPARARSETMAEFPWHTDCSYEEPAPRFLALHVLQHDRRGGGTLSVLPVDRLLAGLSPAARAALARPHFRIAVPPEFVKSPARTHIVANLLAGGAGAGPALVRFRDNITTPLNDDAARALGELRLALARVEDEPASVLRLTARDLPQGSVILLDNRRWLHARDGVKDPERHLRRVRWDALPFPCASN